MIEPQNLQALSHEQKDELIKSLVKRIEEDCKAITFTCDSPDLVRCISSLLVHINNTTRWMLPPLKWSET
jgi:hypothetical protein